MATTETETSSEAAAAPLSHRDILLVFSALVVAIFLAALDSTIVSTALPTVVRDLKGFNHIAWVVTAYLLGTTLATPLWAKLGDMRGRKSPLQLTIVIFLLGSCLCGFAQSMNQLIAFRFLQGIGGGGIIVMVQSTIGELVPVRQRGRYQGYTQGTFAFASVAGPLIGGTLVESIGWRWIFFINLPIGAVALALTQIRLQLPKRRVQAPVDIRGAVLLIVGLAALVVYTSTGGDSFSWISAQSLLYVAAIAVMIWAFLKRESAFPEPILPTRFFRDGTFRLSIACLSTSTCSLFAMTVYIPVFQQVIRGFTPTQSGLLLSPLMVSLTVSSTFSGRRVAKTGRYKTLAVAGLTCVTASLTLIAAVVHPTTPTWVLCVLGALFGAGYGPLMQMLIQAVQYSVPSRDIGSATGTAGLSRMLGGSLGTAVFGAIFAAGLTPALVRAVNSGVVSSGSAASAARSFGDVTSSISHVFIAAAAVSAIGLLCAIRLPDRTLHDG